MDNIDGIRPDTVTINLLQDGVKIDSKSVSAADDGSWSFRFDGLAKYAPDGNAFSYATLFSARASSVSPFAEAVRNEYTYTVTEDPITGYSIDISGDAASGFSVTNTHIPETSISVTKSWVGETGEAVTIHLLADGTDTGQTLTLSADNNWEDSFDNLVRFKEDGSETVYSVSEDALDGYSSEIAGDAATGFTVTNTLIPEEPEPSTTPDDSGTPEDDGEPGETNSDTALPETGESDSPVEILSLIASSLLAAATALSIARRRFVQ